MSDIAPPPEDVKLSHPKPRPPRDWRAILTELAIVVVGVCLAMAAQQAVDWLHWHGEVQAARKTLAAEIGINNINFARRIAYRPCMDRQILEAAAIISDLEAKRTPGTYTALHTGVEQLYDDSRWQSLRASQVLTHFPAEELALMSRHYSSLEGFRLWMDHEGYAWADLSVLRNPPAGLTGSDFLRLRASLTIARRMNAITVMNAERRLRTSRQLGIDLPTAEPERVQKFCDLSDGEFAAYQRTLEPRN